MKISSFNVNSIRARLPNLLKWLKESNPDVALLQELKCQEGQFPFEEILDAGYNSIMSGQKSYNGVAILSKNKIEDVVTTLPLIEGSDVTEDEQARYIEGVICSGDKAVRVASIYVPNGGGEIVPGETLESSKKFLYKIDFFNRLKNHFVNLAKYDEIQIFGGDYNVAVEEIDVFDPKSLANTVCFHDLERQKFREILNAGLTDSYRAFGEANDPENTKFNNFSWWDYRGGAWQHNKGMRIDYLLTSPKASDLISNVEIEDKGVRDQEKASDHCPVTVEIVV